MFIEHTKAEPGRGSTFQESITECLNNTDLAGICQGVIKVAR